MVPRRWAAWCVFALLFCGMPICAGAHPLGNFTINHLARVRIEHGKIALYYVLDIAEIPTFQIMHSGGSEWSRRELDAWAQAQASYVAQGLRVDADGRTLTLEPSAASAKLRPGAGGLPTLYWTGVFGQKLPTTARTISITDRVYSDRRIGWKDIVIGSEPEPTQNLTQYPSALVGSPRHVSAVRLSITGAGSVVDVVRSEDGVVNVNGSSTMVRSNPLTDMFSNPDRSALFILLTVVVAFGLGALHAIEPGHGKALLAFTLVGSRATVKQAMILAASLTVAHTAGVFLLGIVLFFVAGFAAENVYPWITLLSGVAIACIGARSLARYLHGSIGHGHDHHHDLAHDHHHGDGKAHSHAIAGTEKIGFRSAVVAAMSGGVAPCPAAVVVMLAALRLHQLGYGMLLIVVFSMGLAAVLTSLGIAVVQGSAWISRSARFERLIAVGPLLSAVLIAIVGSVMLAQGFVSVGVSAPLWLLCGLVLCAIAGYSISAQHTHVHPEAARR